MMPCCNWVQGLLLLVHRSTIASCEPCNVQLHSAQGNPREENKVCQLPLQAIDTYMEQGHWQASIARSLASALKRLMQQVPQPRASNSGWCSFPPSPACANSKAVQADVVN
jgi:hypothetical protein